MDDYLSGMRFAIRAGLAPKSLEEFRPRLAHPEDDFMEASIDATDDDKTVDAIMDEINAIVDRYGGLCCECGPIPSEHIAFEELFGRPKCLIN